jgi:hypothetical protein
MSDRYRDDDEIDLDEAPPPRRRGRVLAIMVALFAVGGFGGVLWYAYTQGQRSADAVAPILRADESPSRVRPDQPGGMVVPHQDKLVLNNMQQAVRPGQPERLLPPAEAPLPQTTRTAPPPMTSVPLPIPPAPVPATPPVATQAVPPPATPVVPPPPVAMAPPVVVPPPPAPIVIPPMPPPANNLVVPPAPPPVAPSASAPPVTPQSIPAMPPPTQSATATARPTPAPNPAPSPTPAAATVPNRTGSGEWRIQLGSFPAVEQASVQWDRLRRAHAELQPLSLTTVRVDLGARGVWYRVQAGPLNESGARQICEDLKSKKRDCLVVRP